MTDDVRELIRQCRAVARDEGLKFSFHNLGEISRNSRVLSSRNILAAKRLPGLAGRVIRIGTLDSAGN